MLCGNYILSNRSEWTFYFLSSVQFNFTIGEKDIDVKDEKPQMINNYNILGNIQNSQIQQGNTNSKQKRSSIKDLIGNLFGSLFGHLFK